MKRLVLAAPFLATMTCLAGEIETVDSSPVAEGGDYIRRITIDEHHWSYVHVFTNASAAQTFKSTVGWPMKVRYLVVGGGGAGGNAVANKAGGGGGGGGGVAEVDNEPFAAGASWSVCVGNGATEQSTQAGSSSISNGVSEICTVPGGGSGGRGLDSTNYVEPIAGAAGGGSAFTVNGAGAVGTFASYVLGMTPPAQGYSGGKSKSFAAGGGGGAGAAGADAVNSSGQCAGSGGEGLVSDITGEEFVYGSGGGGGSVNGSSNKGPGGVGGTNAGNGGGRNLETTKTDAPTVPVPNSGAGGGGGAASSSLGNGTAGAAGIVAIRYDYNDYPCVGGDRITVLPKSGGKTTFIHVFTNIDEVASFYNRSGKELKLRYLVVGGGGAGGKGYSNFPGGGGGGGGVAEVNRVAFATGTEWMIRVGAGSTEELTQAGSSSISNGVNEICAVPGGGSGGRLEADGTYSPACVGAAGGGGATSENTSSAYHDGAKGTFASYVLGMTPSTEGDGYSGGKSWSFFAGGGGGAGAVGGSPAGSKHGGHGGEGLASDITGEPFVYGSGGGGGAVNGGSNYGPGGNGGTNAGNGGGVLVVDDVKGDAAAATNPVPNSGGGGGGGGAGGSFKTATMGADGIVVIRYDYRPVDPGAVLILR